MNGHSRTSNFGCRAELGRLPLIIYILNGVLKFYVRLRDFSQDSLMFHVGWRGRCVNCWIRSPVLAIKTRD